MIVINESDYNNNNNVANNKINECITNKYNKSMIVK